MLANPTYKQLEASLRIGALTIAQWMQALTSALAAVLFAMYVSPFGVGPTIFLTVVLAGMPVALSYGAMAQEWSVVEAVTAQWRWLHEPQRHLPGPGVATRGYSVSEPDATDAEDVRGAIAAMPTLPTDVTWGKRR